MKKNKKVENSQVETEIKKEPNLDVKESATNGITESEKVLLDNKSKKSSKAKQGKKGLIKKTVTIVEESTELHEIPDELKQRYAEIKPKEKKAKKPRKKEIKVIRYNPDVETGLTDQEAENRRILGMANNSKTKTSKSYFAIFFTNIFTLFNLIMYPLAVWLITVGAKPQNLVFLVVTTINIIIGIVQEIKAKLTIEKLTILQQPTITVLREGSQKEIKSKEIVLDDLIILKPGRQIPCDCVLVSDGGLEVNEALLTGESDAIVKDKKSALYAGSFVVSGAGVAQVVAVGKNVYIEKLTSQVRKVKKNKSELLKSLKLLITILTVLIIPIGFTLFYFSTNHLDFSNSAVYKNAVEKTAGAMVGMVPTGLFLLTSVALSVGVLRLAKHNTLVHNLYCIETLARINVLCLDKTGTITDGSMSVNMSMDFNQTESMYSNEQLLQAFLNIDNSDNPTNTALIERFGNNFALKHNAYIPFSSSRKYSAIEFEQVGTFYLGAPEYIIKSKFKQISDNVERYILEGFRVLVFGYTKTPLGDKIPQDVTPLSLIVIEDTIRTDALDTIKFFKTMGVDIKVISGDNPLTVSRIAERVEIENYNKYISLENVKDEEIENICTEYTIFGRVNPTQKRLLVQALKKKGKTVAMTGDGVNDILALREADTSIAMAEGSEAARNVAEVVLMDSNFSSMPKIVAEGRRVINNIEKVTTLFITKTIFSVVLSLIAIYLAAAKRGAYPLEPIQLVPIESLAIGIPSFFLALEYNNSEIKKDNFLWSIIKKSMPSALTIILECVLIYSLSKTLNLTAQGHERVIPTLIVYSATTICLITLHKICLPMNFKRGMLVTTMISIFIVLVTFMSEFFAIAPIFKVGYYTGNTLNVQELLLLVILLQAGWPLMYLFTNIVAWTKKRIHNAVVFFRDSNNLPEDSKKWFTLAKTLLKKWF